MTKCFIVAHRRSDGALPKPEKCYDEIIFFDLDEAQGFCEEARKAHKDTAVFRCNIEVIEEVKD